MRIKLPNGLLDGADLFNYVVIDELRGKQQNYLANRDLISTHIGHIPKILEDMILEMQSEAGIKWKGKIADAVTRLCTADLEMILIKIRENTYGPRFYHEATCEHCGEQNKDLRLDLDKLEVTYFTVEQIIQPKVTTLPKSQKEVEFKSSTLQDLFDVIKISKTKSDTLITSYMATAIKRIGDKSPITDKDIEVLSVIDLEHLQDQLEQLTLQGSIDTEVETTCKHCSKDFKYKLSPFDPSFFVRTKGSTTSNT